MKIPETRDEFIKIITHVNQYLRNFEVPVYSNLTVIQEFICRILNLLETEGIENIPDETLGTILYSYVKYNAELQNISIKEYMIRLFGKEYCEYNFDWEDLFSDALIKGYTVI